MNPRVLLCIGLVLGCSALRGHSWTEQVSVIGESSPPEIVVEDARVRIACPLSRVLAYAEHPIPLTPRQREIAEHHPDTWADIWRDYAVELAAGQAPRPRRPDKVKDFVHAGLCQVVDRRTNEAQAQIQVVVTHDPERRGGGGRREFRFEDGTTFLGAVDWLP